MTDINLFLAPLAAERQIVQRLEPRTASRPLELMSNEIRLRDVQPDDLPIFFEHQLDPDSTTMAGFPSRDRAAFDAHWANNILGNPDAVIQTILFGDHVAGHIGSWEQDGVRLVGYWIGKEYWGKGVATQALARFVDVVTARPLHAHVVRHNLASIRVLEKCGFRLEHEERGELVLVLRSGPELHQSPPGVYPPRS